jgi:hypothetical protein
LLRRHIDILWLEGHRKHDTQEPDPIGRVGPLNSLRSAYHHVARRVTNGQTQSHPTMRDFDGGCCTPIVSPSKRCHIFCRTDENQAFRKWALSKRRWPRLPSYASPSRHVRQIARTSSRQGVSWMRQCPPCISHCQRRQIQPPSIGPRYYGRETSYETTVAFEYLSGRRRCPGRARARAEQRANASAAGRNASHSGATGPGGSDNLSTVRLRATAGTRHGRSSAEPTR